MTEALNRHDLVELLQSLGDERDEEVLAAARELHALVTDAGADWDDLLVAESAEEAPPEAAESQSAAEPVASAKGSDTETLALIEKLLAKPGISDDFRDELNGYKNDIAQGEFEESDHGYVRALYKRLMK